MEGGYFSFSPNYLHRVGVSSKTVSGLSIQLDSMMLFNSIFEKYLALDTWELMRKEGHHL